MKKEKEIIRIDFSEKKPNFTSLKKKDPIYVNTYYCEEDEGYWIIYSDSTMTPEEVFDNLTDENLDKYYNVF